MSLRSLVRKRAANVRTGATRSSGFILRLEHPGSGAADALEPFVARPGVDPDLEIDLLLGLTPRGGRAQGRGRQGARLLQGRLAGAADIERQLIGKILFAGLLLAQAFELTPQPFLRSRAHLGACSVSFSAACPACLT